MNTTYTLIVSEGAGSGNPDYAVSLSNEGYINDAVALCAMRGWRCSHFHGYPAWQSAFQDALALKFMRDVQRYAASGA